MADLCRGVFLWPVFARLLGHIGFSIICLSQIVTPNCLLWPIGLLPLSLLLLIIYYQQLLISTIMLAMMARRAKLPRKTFGLKYRYGDEPLYRDHMYNEAVENDETDSLAYKEIRFASLWETNSPLQDDILERYIRFMLHDGRRGLMYRLMHNTFYEIKTIQYKRMLKKQASEEGKAPVAGDNDEEEIMMNPLELFHRAVNNCKPLVITKKVRRGGATYQVPYPLRASDSEYLAMKWLNQMILDRPKPRVKHYYQELAQEIIEAANGRGKVVKKKDDIHKLAQANKAYSHYRWG